MGSRDGGGCGAVYIISGGQMFKCRIGVPVDGRYRTKGGVVAMASRRGE